MKKEDILNPNPEAIDEATKRITDIVKKEPSNEFFEKIELTLDEKEVVFACTGLLFSIKNNQYFGKTMRTLTCKKTARILRRKSCSCSRCDYIIRELLPSQDFNSDYSYF